jgi:hypothetical protein
MAVEKRDEQDLQSLAALLADIERQISEVADHNQLFHLRQLKQRCLLELYLLKRNPHEPQ